MRFGSVCSGIEAASVAWSLLGWDAAFFAEIERFPSEVLAHRYGSNLPGEPLSRNAPPNLGDITRFQDWPDAAFDVLVGGTPCQSFSVAGLRKGMADPRGNLALTYLGIADRYRPRWLVWENVPGVLSSNGGRDFGAFLGGLGELGYGFAYRVLDAQFVRVDGLERAVPQRRRRVFVVGYLGDWRRAAAVLFERESLLGHPAPRREARQAVAGTVAGGARSRGGYSADDIPLTVSGTLGVRTTDHPNGMKSEADFIVPVVTGGGPDGGRISGAVSAKWSKGTGGPAGDEAYNLVAEPAAPPITGNPYGDHESREGLLVAHALRANGFDASEDGTGRGTPIVPVPYTLAVRGRDGGHDLEYRQDGTANAVLTPSGGRAGIGVGAIAFSSEIEPKWSEEIAPTLKVPSASGGGQPACVAVPFDTTQITSAGNYSVPKAGDPCHPLSASAHPPAIAFDCKAGANTGFAIGEVPGALRGEGHGGGHAAVAFDYQQGGDPTNSMRMWNTAGTLETGRVQAVYQAWAVRRLTPMECERLQGFPDGYTDIMRGKKAAADGSRYKALGNSMAVNVMRWLGRRIAMVDAMQVAEERAA